MSCGVDCRVGSDLALLWLWHRLAATALIWPLAWEPPYAMGVALEKAKAHTRAHIHTHTHKRMPVSNFVYWSKNKILPRSFFFFLFRAIPEVHGSFPARGHIGATAAGLQPQPQPQEIWATSAIYTAAHGNTRSPTHWVRPGIEPTSSWLLFRFIFTVPQWELPQTAVLNSITSFRGYLLDFSTVNYFFITM